MTYKAMLLGVCEVGKGFVVSCILARILLVF